MNTSDTFCCDLQSEARRRRQDDVTAWLVFSDEVTSHLCSKINRWVSENLHQNIGHERDSPNINVFSDISQYMVCGPVFTTTVNVYLDMLINWFMPLLHEDAVHSNFTKMALLLASTAKWDETWTQCLTDEGDRLEKKIRCFWPLRSPDVTPPNFFLWGCMKDTVFIYTTIPLASVTSEVLVKVSEETEHQIDVCRATRGAYIEFAGNFMRLASDVYVLFKHDMNILGFRECAPVECFKIFQHFGIHCSCHLQHSTVYSQKLLIWVL
jgi:hypothetical protein